MTVTMAVDVQTITNISALILAQTELPPFDADDGMITNDYSSSYSSSSLFYNCCMKNDSTIIDVQCDNYYCGRIYTLLRLPSWLEVLLTFLFILGMVMSLVGNVSVMSVLTCGRRKKRTFNILLLNLALADWTLGILCMPFVFANIIMNEWIFGLGMCKFTPFSLKVSEIVSIFTLTVIGLDRYYVVMYPLRPRMDNRKKKIIILITWVLAIGISAPKLWVLETDHFAIDEKGTLAAICGEVWPSELDGHVYEWALFVITFVLPLLVLTFCYGRVARKLWTRNLPGNADPERDREQRKNKRKTIRMLISVVVLFALCWLPMNVYNLVKTFHPNMFDDSPTSTRIFRASVLIWLTLADTIINPIVYVFISDRFRKDLKSLFIRWTRRLRSDGGETYNSTDWRSQYTCTMESSPCPTRRTRLSPSPTTTGRRTTNMMITYPTTNGNYLTVGAASNSKR
ncbi:prolactin-releasing peptide receptor-like isoform X2 [Glandiceps talaboti]